MTWKEREAFLGNFSRWHILFPSFQDLEAPFWNVSREADWTDRHNIPDFLFINQGKLAARDKPQIDGWLAPPKIETGPDTRPGNRDIVVATRAEGDSRLNRSLWVAHAYLSRNCRELNQLGIQCGIQNLDA